MLSIAYRGNASKPHEIPPVRMSVIKKRRGNKRWQVCYRKRTHKSTIGGNVNWHSHYGEIPDVPEKVKNTATVCSSNPTFR